MKTTPPFISEVVEEYEKKFPNTESPIKSYGEYCAVRDFLREKLTAVYERGRGEGRKEAVNYIKDNMMFGRDISKNIVFEPNEFTDLLVAALTTEGE